VIVRFLIAHPSRVVRYSSHKRVRQDGSHIRLTTSIGGTHHVMAPVHRPCETGTLPGGVLKPVAAHHKLTVDELLKKLSL